MTINDTPRDDDTTATGDAEVIDTARLLVSMDIHQPLDHDGVMQEVAITITVQDIAAPLMPYEIADSMYERMATAARQFVREYVGVPHSTSALYVHAGEKT